jgi:hypothetical protein
MLRYKLRALLLWSTVAPLVIALAYWAVEFALGGPLQPQLYFALLTLAIYAYIDIWRGIDRLICGPTAAQSWRPKPRRRVRVRIQRYAVGST